MAKLIDGKDEKGSRSPRGTIYEPIRLEDYSGVMSFMENWYKTTQAKSDGVVVQLEPLQSPNTNA